MRESVEESVFQLLFVDHKVVPGDMSRGSGDLGDVRWGAIAQNQDWPIPTQPGHSQSVRTCDVPKQASSWQSTDKRTKTTKQGGLCGGWPAMDLE